MERILPHLESIIKEIDAKDGFTAKHSKTVSRLSVTLAKKMELPEDQINTIKIAGLLHDIGKIGIPDKILTKKGKYNKKEYEIMKGHSFRSWEMLSQIKQLKKELPIILSHHERYDGKGYPNGISGKRIPLGARILSVCDSFEAMTSLRLYKETLSRKQAIRELIKNKGKQFDPAVVDAFVEMLKENNHPSFKERNQ